MAKAATLTDKPPKMAKKTSQQDLKADKLKKTKQTAEKAAPAASAPSSSKAKKDTRAKDAVEEPQAPPAKLKSKAKGEKSEQSTAAAAPAETKTAEKKSDKVEGKKKKKSAVAEELPEESAQKSKKPRRGSTAARPAEETTKKAARKAASPEPQPSKKGKAVIATPEAFVQFSPTEKESKKSKSKSKSAPKAPTPAPEEQASEEEDAAEEEQDFYGFSSDDDDSSDDEMAEDIPGIDIGKLPTVAKDDETVKRKLEKAKRKPTEDRGVIYLGRIPHGFFEDQMRAYFAQFGTVTRLRLSRNKKTGKSKHYAFIEFDSSSVAEIVAETMDNYLLMGHILTCKLIPKDQVHPELWVGANRKWRPVPRERVARVAHNKRRTQEEQEKAENRLLKRQEQRKRKLADAGINYDFEAVAYVSPPISLWLFNTPLPFRTHR
ncbi:hypothetical protein BD413DRAFT_669790 [Trametes elegans]|nr:hypothetical protein BD413DRAFT_669790 [Trametes elegans]